MEILYHDRSVVVVVKPVGLLSEDAPEDSLPRLLSAEFGEIYAVHRLDRVVGGVMVYARTKKSAATLSRAVAENRLQKCYEAVLEGVPEQDEGTLSDLLFKDVRAGKAFVVGTERRGAKRATLTYRTLASVEHEGRILSRVEVLLQTGRFHQIRVQFASRQMPLVGDGKYGARVKASSPALFATSLTFPHPESGRDVTFCAPVPNGFPWSLFGDTGYEIERKFLVAYPDISKIEGITGCRKREILQTYLQAEKGETHRVRRVLEGDKITYMETRKLRISMLRAVEEEREITEGEYRALLEGREAGSCPIEKTRYAFPFGTHVVELDLYPFWQDRAIVEVELKNEDESFSLPPFLRVLKEVTDDKRYKNVNLAKLVPSDDIST